MALMASRRFSTTPAAPSSDPADRICRRILGNPATEQESKQVPI